MRARFAIAFAILLGVSFTAVLWRSGCTVFMPREATVPRAPDKIEEDEGFRDEEVQIAITGPIEIVHRDAQTQQPELRLSAADCDTERLEGRLPPRYRVTLREPLLILYGTAADAPTGPPLEKIRIAAHSAQTETESIDLRSMLASLAGPIALRQARVSIDQNGDRRFESGFEAAHLECNVEISPPGQEHFPLRRIEARGTAERPVDFHYEQGLLAHAARLTWLPTFLSEREFLSSFRFGAEFLGTVRSRAPARPERGTRQLRIEAPLGANLEIGEALAEKTAGARYRSAQLLIAESVRIHEERIFPGERPAEEGTAVSGRGGRFDLRLPDLDRDPGAQAPRPEILKAEIAEDLAASGDFGRAQAGQGVLHFRTSDAGSRLESLELAGPLEWHPAEDEDLLAKMGLQTEQRPAEPLVLSCREGATIRAQTGNPEAGTPTRYRVELREKIRLGPAGGEAILAAERSLQALLQSARPATKEGVTPGPNLELLELVALGGVVVKLQGDTARAQRLEAQTSGQGSDREAVQLKLSGEPEVVFRDPRTQRRMKLGCAGEIRLRLRAGKLESAHLDREVRVRPLEVGPDGFTVDCHELEVLGSPGSGELDLHASGDVRFDQQERRLHVRCQVLRRGADQAVQLWGRPALVKLERDEGQVRIEAAYLYLEERTQTIFALGLTRRVRVSPPPELLAQQGTAEGAGEVALLANLALARLGEKRAGLIALGHVEIRGDLSADAAMLRAMSWSEPPRQSLSLDSLGLYPVSFARPFEGAMVRGSARLLRYSGEENLSLVGPAELNWEGEAGSLPIDALPGLVAGEPSSSRKTTLVLEARDSILLTSSRLELHGDASARQGEKQGTCFSAQAIILVRDEQKNPRLLRLLGHASITSGEDVDICGKTIEIDLTRGDEVFKVWGEPASFRYGNTSYANLAYLEYSHRTRLPRRVVNYR